MKTLSPKNLMSIICCAAAISTCSAASFISLSNTSNWIDTNYSYVGYSFTVGTSDLLVYSLGIYDAGPNGLIETDLIGIIRDGGGGVASVFFEGNEPLSSGFRWESLSTPVTLFAGQTYRTYLNATYLNSPFIEHIWSGSTSDAALQFNPAIATINGSLTGSTYSAFSIATPTPGQINIGPNFQFTVVPEPCTAFLLLSGGLLVFRRRSLRTHQTQ